MHRSMFLISFILWVATPVRVTGSTLGNPCVVNATALLTRTPAIRSTAWAALGYDLAAALAGLGNTAANPGPTTAASTVSNPVATPPASTANNTAANTGNAALAAILAGLPAAKDDDDDDDVPTVVIGPGQQGNTNAPGGQTNATTFGGQPTVSAPSAQANTSTPGTQTATGTGVTANPAVTQPSATKANPPSGANPAANGTTSASGNGAGLNEVVIDDDGSSPPPATANRGKAVDKVGGVGGPGTGDMATDAELAAFFDAKTSTELLTKLRDLHAAFDGKENPSQQRPMYVAHDVATEAYRNWTGKATADPCKDDLVKDVMFTTPPGCMTHLDKNNMPAHVGVPSLRRRSCYYTCVRCVEKKALMLTQDALKRQIDEQLGDRAGGSWYFGNTYAKPDIVNSYYRQAYPNSGKTAADNVCSNKGPDEFSTEYNMGAIVAIFAESEKCLTGVLNADRKPCRRIVVNCIGK